MKFNIRPPRVNVNLKNGAFWKQIVMIVIGTTISLFLTVITAQMMEKHQRAKDRRLSAMMVMSNIELFARLMDGYSEVMGSSDSIATWLLSKPIEELELLPEDELNALVDQAAACLFISYDKSAQNIFSNNVETWKNMGNIEFINTVGQCFSSMNSVEEYWNKRANDMNGTVLEIKDHPDRYEGSSVPIKIISYDKMRRSLQGIHQMRAWFSHVAATMRYYNRQNMAAIGISEQEVMDFTNDLELGAEDAGAAPEFSDYCTPPLSPDSLPTMRDFEVRLQKLKSSTQAQ